MMLMPCWPRAGPTGGAGDAWPPVACSLIWVRTFFAMSSFGWYGLRWGSGGGGRFRSDLLDLIEADLDRRLATEDRDEDLELRGVLVDLGDLAREVRQRPRD